MESYLDHAEEARRLVEDSHKLLSVYSLVVSKTLSDAVRTDVLEGHVAWIKEELRFVWAGNAVRS